MLAPFAIAVSVLALAGPTAAQRLYSGQFTIRPKANRNFCLTSQSTGGSEYSTLLLRECILVVNQSWWVNAEGGPTTVTYAGWDFRSGPRPDPPELCMGSGISRSHTRTYSTSNGAYAEMYSCDEAEGVSWAWDTSTMQFRSTESQLCLDVTDGQFVQDTIVQTWVCHDSCHSDYANQQWALHWDPEDSEPSYPCFVWMWCQDE